MAQNSTVSDNLKVETVRAQSRTVGTERVNRVLAQPHYRSDHDHPAA